MTDNKIENSKTTKLLKKLKPNHICICIYLFKILLVLMWTNSTRSPFRTGSWESDAVSPTSGPRGTRISHKLLMSEKS